MPMHKCARGGGRESIRNWHFLVVVPRANCSTCFIFLRLMRHFLARHFLARCSFSFFAVVMPKWKADKHGALGHQEKESETSTTDFQRGISNIHVLWNPHPGHTIVWWCYVCCINFQSFIPACMTLWICVLFTYQNMYNTLTILSLHWKLDFNTRESIEGFAAL